MKEKFDWNNLICEILEGNFGLGTYVKVKINGKEYTRKVYDQKGADLYIKVKGYKIWYSEFYKN